MSTTSRASATGARTRTASPAGTRTASPAGTRTASPAGAPAGQATHPAGTHASQAAHSAGTPASQAAHSAGTPASQAAHSATAAFQPAALQPAVHQPAVLTSSVPAPAVLTSSAPAPAVLTSSAPAPALPTSSTPGSTTPGSTTPGSTTPGSTTRGLIIAVIAAFSFGASGALVKPLLESGWSPAAAVTARALIGGLVLLPFAIVAMRGNWAALWRARVRVGLMAAIGVAGCQLAYFAAVQRIPVNTAILIEYMAPLLLVVWVWMRTRRIPKAVVFIGSAVAIGGLVLIVSPGGATSLDALGLIFAAVAAIGCAIYYVIAAAPSDGLPPVAFAAFGLLGGGVVLGAVGAVGVVPFTATFGTVELFGSAVAWWIPLLIVGIIATAVAYATSITATEMLGSRLASFAGLLEVVAAALYAWILLGESLTVLQLLGGVLILAGIGFVRSDRTDVPIEPVELLTAPIAIQGAGVRTA
jgi:drug/metabolite transporter (DMT)-like permease